MLLLALILCKFPFSFLTVKVKLGHRFSQFILRFKSGIFECWSYGSFIYDIYKELEREVMKFLAVLQIVVDDFHQQPLMKVGLGKVCSLSFQFYYIFENCK